MNELQIFNYGKVPVRTVLVDDAPWWVLKDVCRVLGITNHKNVSARLDPDEKGVRLMDPLSGDGNPIHTLGGPQNMTIINESGLYKVILRSDKPEAKKFTRWVTHEVLPALRKTGSYSMVPGGPPPVQFRALTSDDYITAARLASDCRNERLPYVLGFLERGGFDIPKVEAHAPAKPAPCVMAVEERALQILNLEDFL